MTNSNRLLSGSVCLLLGAAFIPATTLHAGSPSTLGEISFVGDIHQSIPLTGGGSVFAGDDGFFVFNPSTGTGQAFSFFGELPQAGLDGFHSGISGACPNATYYSLDTWANVDGLLIVGPADVFRLYEKVLDGQAAGVPDGVNVDAVSVDPVTCDLVISIDIVATLGGVTYKPDDLIRWNGTSFSLYRTLNFGVNIDALHIISDTRFLFSIDSDGLVPGLAAQDDDVIESVAGGPGSFQFLAFSPRIFDNSWIASDLVGLSARVREDEIFADGFEEITVLVQLPDGNDA